MNIKAGLAAAVPGFFVGGPIGALLGLGVGMILPTPAVAAALPAAVPPPTPGVPASTQASADLINLLTTAGPSALAVSPVAPIQANPLPAVIGLAAPTAGAPSSSQAAADLVNALVNPPAVLTSAWNPMPTNSSILSTGGPPTTGGVSAGAQGQTPGIVSPIPTRLGPTLSVMPGQVSSYGDFGDIAAVPMWFLLTGLGVAAWIIYKKHQEA